MIIPEGLFVVAGGGGVLCPLCEDAFCVYCNMHFADCPCPGAMQDDAYLDWSVDEYNKAAFPISEQAAAHAESLQCVRWKHIAAIEEFLDAASSPGNKRSRKDELRALRLLVANAKANRGPGFVSEPTAEPLF